MCSNNKNKSVECLFVFMENEEVRETGKWGGPDRLHHRAFRASRTERRVQYILNMNITSAFLFLYLLLAFFSFSFSLHEENAFRMECREMERRKKNNKQQATQSVKSASTKYQQRALSLRINNKNSFLV